MNMPPISVIFSRYVQIYCFYLLLSFCANITLK